MTTVDLRTHGLLHLPESLLANLRDVHGERVQPWLDGLGPLLVDVLGELDARVVAGEPPLSYHLVFFAVRPNGDEIVVKCTVPNDEQLPEVAAVHALSDAGIGPRMLWADLGRGVLAMERVRPGHMIPTNLPTLDQDAEHTRTIATLASKMARQVDIDRWQHQLIPVRRYSRALGEVAPDTSLWQQHRGEILHALDLREKLLADSSDRGVFLHGDLHHYNALADDRHGWRVIDPKGLLGPAGYEFGALTYNPMGIQSHPDLSSIERQRVDIWSEVTGLPWETVRSWGFVAAVLSACWSGEGGGTDWQDAMTVANTLRDLAPLR